MSEYFTEDTSSEVVNARMGSEVDPRLRQIMHSLVSHLHAFIKDVEPTTKEWETAIEFLTKTGQMCSDTRQEFILLSDVLGVSMLVDAINHRRPDGATENTVFGPFHVDGAPERRLRRDDVRPWATTSRSMAKARVAFSKAGSSTSTAIPWKAPSWTSGPTMPKGSMTFSSPVYNRNGIIGVSFEPVPTGAIGFVGSSLFRIRFRMMVRLAKCLNA